LIIREFPRLSKFQFGVGTPQFPFDPLALADIADRTQDNKAIGGGNRAKADFNWEF